MNTRLQVTLPAEQHRRARRKAAELGISLAEYLRRLVERDLAGIEPERDPGAIFDLGDSAGSDIAAEKDAMIGEAVGRRR
jgi:hypothetical protein